MPVDMTHDVRYTNNYKYCHFHLNVFFHYFFFNKKRCLFLSVSVCFCLSVSVCLFLSVSVCLFLSVSVCLCNSRYNYNLHLPSTHLTLVQKSALRSGSRLYKHLTLNSKILSNDAKRFRSTLRNYRTEHTFYNMWK